jgi:hypothetical protein
MKLTIRRVQRPFCTFQLKKRRSFCPYRKKAYLWPTTFDAAFALPPFSNKNKNDDPASGVPDEKKPSLKDIKDGLTVLDKDEMVKLEGGKTGSRSFTDVLGWSSSLGETIPQ